MRTTMTAKEAAAYLGISYWLVLELSKQKRLKHVRAGKRVLFRKESLDEWMSLQEELSVKKESTTQGILKKIEI